jgi:hypothetical protein
MLINVNGILLWWNISIVWRGELRKYWVYADWYFCRIVIFRHFLHLLFPSWEAFQILLKNKNKTNSVAFSPQANYTDWATATCWQNLVPTFADPLRPLTQFSTPEPLLSFKSLLIYPHKGWVDPVPDPLLLRKSLSVGNRTQDLSVSSQEVWPLDHRGGRFL